MSRNMIILISIHPRGLLSFYDYIFAEIEMKTFLHLSRESADPKPLTKAAHGCSHTWTFLFFSISCCFFFSKLKLAKVYVWRSRGNTVWCPSYRRFWIHQWLNVSKPLVGCKEKIALKRTWRWSTCIALGTENVFKIHRILLLKSMLPFETMYAIRRENIIDDADSSNVDPQSEIYGSSGCTTV